MRFVTVKHGAEGSVKLQVRARARVDAILRAACAHFYRRYQDYRLYEERTGGEPLGNGLAFGSKRGKQLPLTLFLRSPPAFTRGRVRPKASASASKPATAPPMRAGDLCPCGSKLRYAKCHGVGSTLQIWVYPGYGAADKTREVTVFTTDTVRSVVETIYGSGVLNTFDVFFRAMNGGPLKGDTTLQELHATSGDALYIAAKVRPLTLTIAKGDYRGEMTFTSDMPVRRLLERAVTQQIIGLSTADLDITHHWIVERDDGVPLDTSKRFAEYGIVSGERLWIREVPKPASVPITAKDRLTMIQSAIEVAAFNHAAEFVLAIAVHDAEGTSTRVLAVGDPANVAQLAALAFQDHARPEIDRTAKLAAAVEGRNTDFTWRKRP